MYRAILFFILICACVLHADESATIIYLIRHGQTDWNLNQKVQGGSNIPLNENGRKQAEAMAVKLRGVPFCAVFSSDLDRAKETAEILIQGRGLDIQVDPRFRERGFGSWEGKDFEEYLKAADDQRLDVESSEAMRERVLAALDEVAALYPGKTILVSSHGGALKYIVAFLLGLPLSTHIGVENLGYVELGSCNGVWQVRDLQGIHLPAMAR